MALDLFIISILISIPIPSRSLRAYAHTVKFTVTVIKANKFHQGGPSYPLTAV